MIKINIYKQSNFSISSVKVKKILSNFFSDHGIVSDACATVSFVNEKEMRQIGKKYYKPELAGRTSKTDDRVHNVFSFVGSESPKFPTDNDVINLGEIIVCFPVCVREASLEGKLVEDKIIDLIKHSALHLLGIHHKE